jgi:NIMA (never in mitosis gene a)-related kinase
LKDKEKENALNEIRILASIEDPFIIGYKDAFFDE